jgi:hypothetical protein
VQPVAGHEVYQPCINIRDQAAQDALAFARYIIGDDDVGLADRSKYADDASDRFGIVPANQAVIPSTNTSTTRVGSGMNTGRGRNSSRLGIFNMNMWLMRVSR